MSSLISILIPTINRGDLYIKTVECTFRQTPQNKEIIVSDDASSDSKQKISLGKIKNKKNRLIK